MKQNFDRFISCKTTIDDIYVKLQRIESAGTGISSAVLFNAVTDVQGAAKRAFGPLLERHSKAERIKSVQALLRRFQSLFSMPSRVRGLAAARDYEQVAAEYSKANALIRPSAANTAKVWARLHAEIEKVRGALGAGGAGGCGWGGGVSCRHPDDACLRQAETAAVALQQSCGLRFSMKHS